MLRTKEYFYKNLGIYRGTASLVYGLPKETPETILNALDWFCNNWNDQNIVAFPLNISLTGNKSKIDEDYEKYGYTIMGQEKRNLYNRHNFFSNDLTIWENEFMNMYDAIDLVDQQIKSFQPGYVDAWKLFSLIPLAENLEHALSITESGAENDWSHFSMNNASHGEGGGIRRTNAPSQRPLLARAKEIKTAYIEKKLSL